MIYTVSTDKIVRKRTIAAFIIFTFIPLFNLLYSDRWIWYLSFFAFFMLILLFTFLHKPFKYEIVNKNLIIHRLIGDIKIDLKKIISVDRIHHDLLKNENKGGVFGYFGKFYTEVGKAAWYATRRDKLVLITNDDNSKIVLTPDLRDNFIQQLEKIKFTETV